LQVLGQVSEHVVPLIWGEGKRYQARRGSRRRPRSRPRRDRGRR
jgi:hypothetical protein